MSTDEAEFDPWRVSDDVRVAVRPPGSHEPLSLGDRIMVGVSWLFVFFGMVLIGLFLGGVLMSLIDTRQTREFASVAVHMLVWLLLWLPCALYVARLNVRATLRIRRRSRPHTGSGLEKRHRFRDRSVGAEAAPEAHDGGAGNALGAR